MMAVDPSACLYVTGGRQRSAAVDRDEWHQYGEALIARVDRHTGEAEIVMEYVSPPEVTASSDPSIVFKAATLVDQQLFVCTQTEVLVLSLDDMSILHHVTNPLLNDVHHVRPSDRDSLFVANTGLDMVLELDYGGHVLATWSVTDHDPWKRFDPNTDYRRVPTTKPHGSHPNYLFTWDDDLWVTRFEQRDAVRLPERDRRFWIGIERPHDGVVSGSLVWFTTVDGKIVGVHPGTGCVDRVLDLNAASRDGKALGWCRGLSPDADGWWVGFSRIRPTSFRRHLSWLKHGGRRVGQYNAMPTRIVHYDREGVRELATCNLEQLGMNAVFSIVPR